MTTPLRAISKRDDALSARVVRAVPLHYGEGANVEEDRPAHVRAGSSLTWADRMLVIVQDDANFVALADPIDGEVRSLTLPRGAAGRRQFDDERGNKAHKLDLEAVVTLGGQTSELVVAFGSGSTPHRESILLIRGLRRANMNASLSLLAAVSFYAEIRSHPDFAGSELNIEGAISVLHGAREHIRLFNRGNGADRADVRAVNASADVDAAALLTYLEDTDASDPPCPTRITQYDLGSIEGCPLSFTDVATCVTASPDPHILYVAAAEASPDAVRDGPVAGCAIGMIVEQSGGVHASWTPLHDDAGKLFTGKVEGMALDPQRPRLAYLVVDHDRPSSASELLEVVLDGPWPFD